MSYLPKCLDCGWSGKSTTSQARASYATKQHSCDKHLRLLAARERGAAAAAAVDRTPKPCLHKQADHQHGTHAAYVLDRCRCLPCKDANTTYERRRSRQAAYGRWTPFVDAQPSRDHVAALRAQGLGLKLIAKHSGVSHGSLWKLIYGKTQPDGTRRLSVRVKTETAAALLAVRADLTTLAGTTSVDGLGTRRRLQALVAVGWSQARLARLLGMEPGNFGRTINGGRVRVSTAAAVATLYDELTRQMPPESTHRERIAASRARNRARTLDWKPPMWWDVDELDHLEQLPMPPAPSSCDDVDDVAVQRAIDGDLSVSLTIAERREVVRRLHARRLTDGQIDRLTGISSRTVLRIRQELDLPAVVPARGAA